jgi:hypothetical protein
VRIAALIAGALAWTGCYKPAVDASCTVQCNATSPCANGLSCELGVCRDMAGPACTTDAGVADADPDAYLDAPADASTVPDAMVVDAPPGCFGTDPYTYCPLAQPATSWTVSGPVELDTSPAASVLCDPDVPAYCVVASVRITINGRLTAIGSRPLVLVATDRITVTATGVIDVSSNATARGAGANTSGCVAGTPGGATASSGGGGAGGTFSGRGGYGGPSGGATGGTPAANVSTDVAMPRGGCHGTRGGGPNSGDAGLGAGGMVLISAGAIDISGTLLARGGGAGGGGAGSGGGGGGSGGVIALDGFSITITGAMIAAGGGGGGGGSLTAAGNSGFEASVTGTPAAGGTGGGGGGVGFPDGGNGGGGSGPGLLRNGRGGELIMPQGAGGGGGGGAAGVNRIRGMLNTANATIVPPAT